MTREEARIKLIEIRAQLEVILSMYGLEISDVFDIAIKALEQEQEPCEDAVSRDLMTNTLGATCIAKRDEKGDLVALCSIDNLPPVTPQPKEMGRWIEHFDESGKWYECDQCHTDWGGPVNYCPNCGTKMEGDKNG